jgi:hypothetical protein
MGWSAAIDTIFRAKNLYGVDLYMGSSTKACGLPRGLFCRIQQASHLCSNLRACTSSCVETTDCIRQVAHINKEVILLCRMLSPELRTSAGWTSTWVVAPRSCPLRQPAFRPYDRAFQKRPFEIHKVSPCAYWMLLWPSLPALCGPITPQWPYHGTSVGGKTLRKPPKTGFAGLDD